MKNCETCGVPQEKRPGCIRDCIYNGHHRISMNFAGWRPKKPDKTCGNCGWFFNGKLKYNPNYGTCLNKENGWHNTTLSNRRVDDIDCKGWKPICETCGGTGEVEKKHCGACSICHYSKKPWPVNTCAHSYYKNIPCPTCQKPKEERLMVPVEWICLNESQKNLVITNTKRNNHSIYGLIRYKDGKWEAWENMVIRSYIDSYNTPEKAQAAVEKALRIERK